MDIVCPLMRSEWDNEIRYSLRSLEANLSKVDRLFIVGYVPEYLVPDVHISDRGQPEDAKDVIIAKKILAACEQADLSEEFLFINDDHYLLAKLEVPFPFFHKNGLVEEINGRMQTEADYIQPFINSLMRLKMDESSSYTQLNYDLHCPIRYQKKECIALFSGNQPPKGFALKSLYCNSNFAIRQQTIQASDFKVEGPISREQLNSLRPSRLFFSTGEAVHPITKQFLEDTFPKPSRWEKQ